MQIIFWFDDKGEYEDEVSELQLDIAKLHILDGTNWFYLKWLLYESDVESKYLVYAPFPKPSDDNYSGQKPQFIEGDVFRIIVPLDDDYSFDFGQHEHVNQLNQSDQLNQTDLSEDEIILLNLIKEHPDMTNSLLAEALGWSISRVKYYIQKLKKSGKIKRKGTNRSGKWYVL